MKKRAQELLEATLSQDFVGRPVVAKMDHLYNEVLDKLQTRVKVLETTKVAANTRPSKSAGNARRRRQPNIPYGSRNPSATTKKSSRAPLGMGGGGGGLRGKVKSRMPETTKDSTSRKRRERRSRPWASSSSAVGSAAGGGALYVHRRRDMSKKKKAPSARLTTTTAWGVVGNARSSAKTRTSTTTRRRRVGASSVSHVSNVRARRSGRAASTAGRGDARRTSGVGRGEGSGGAVGLYSNPIRGRFR